jgi:hypothetical protein
MSWGASRFDGVVHRKKEGESKHHRRPTSTGGDSSERNISELSTSKHRAWHTLFQNWSPERIAREINDRYLDPDYEMVAVRKLSN